MCLCASDIRMSVFEYYFTLNDIRIHACFLRFNEVNITNDAGEKKDRKGARAKHEITHTQKLMPDLWRWPNVFITRFYAPTKWNNCIYDSASCSMFPLKTHLAEKIEMVEIQ